MNFDPLITNFSGYWPLEESAIKALKDKASHKKIKRREFILNAGQECNHFTFITCGCLKMYKIDSHGNIHNLQFAIENDWIADYGSFYNDEPSELYIQALETTEVFQIKKNDLFYLYDHFPIFDRNFRIIIENTFIEQQKRVLQNISSTAKERYLYFLDKYPNLIQRISSVQIASYLGITPEFLSNIRKQITTR